MESIESIDIGRLKTFVATVENASFRDAADDRDLVPSTVQKHMRALESELGITLFGRRGRTIEVTSEALELCEIAREMIETARKFTARADYLAGRSQQVVRLTCAPLHLAQFLGGVIHSLERSASEIDVRIDLFNSEDLVERSAFDALLDHGESNFVATINPLKGRASLPMWETKIVVVVPDGHRLRNKASISIDDLEGETIFAQSPHVWSRRNLDRLLAHSHVDDVSIVTEVIPDVAVGLALSGFGIAVLADDCLPSLESYPPLLDAGKPITDQVKLYWNKDTLTQASRRFIHEARSLKRHLRTSRHST